MAITLKNIDPKSHLREWTYQINGSASQRDFFINVPYACEYKGYTWAAGLASAGLAIGISNVNTTDAIETDFQIDFSPCGAGSSVAAGAVGIHTATKAFFITQNSLLHVVTSASTGDGVLMLRFELNENVER
jgi:hypothetical protein